MAVINWTDQAQTDLVNIAEFIAKDSARYAKITVERIRTSVKKLAIHPLLGRKVPELEMEAIREIILGNYRIIYYVVSAHQIDILAVHHSAKRLDIDELSQKPI